MSSAIEALLDLHIRAEKLPPPVHELQFLPERKFRFDRAWPAAMLAIEVDGHVHRIKTRFDSDREKHALAILAGWTVLHVTGQHIRHGKAIQWLKALLWERLPLEGPGEGDGPRNACVTVEKVAPVVSLARTKHPLGPVDNRVLSPIFGKCLISL